MRRPHPTHSVVALPKAWQVLSRVRGLPRRVLVSGASMTPSFEPGDRLLVVPVARVAAGDVVAVRDPRVPSRILIKRVEAVGPDGIDVRGDAPSASTDSRHFGPVPPGTVVGRAVYRYHPPARAGWVAE